LSQGLSGELFPTVHGQEPLEVYSESAHGIVDDGCFIAFFLMVELFGMRKRQNVLEDVVAYTLLRVGFLASPSRLRARRCDVRCFPTAAARWSAGR